MNKKRVLWVLAAVGVLALVLGLGAVIGGGVVYALARGGDSLPLSLAQGGDPGYGIVIAYVEPDGAADEAGMVRGDILLELDGQTIENSSDLIHILDEIEPGDELQVVVLHGDEQRTLLLVAAERHGRAYLGLSPCGGDAAGLDIHMDMDSPGAIVIEVTPGSPAEEAGLQVGDIIVSVGEQSLDKTDLADLIAEREAGETVSLTVERPGEGSIEIVVTLASHPDNEDLAYLGVRYVPAPHIGTWYGGPLPFEELEHFEFDELPFAYPESDLSGVIVQQVIEDSPAAAAGIEEGDVITALDGEPVESAQALVEAIADHAPGDEILLTLARSGDQEREVAITLGEHPDEGDRAYLGVWLGGYFRLHRLDDSKELPHSGWRNWVLPPSDVPLDEDDMPLPHIEFFGTPGDGDHDLPWGDGTDTI